MRQSSNDPLIGRTFLNQYIIRKKLGQGGYGSVYEAEQPSISRKAALKILHPHLATQPEIAVRFRREGLAASRLQHAAIVDIYNFGETDDGIIWIAMEHLDGETLSARLRRRGPLSSRELIEILGPICEALQEAHQKGIIHRDLKPDNIMLTRGPNGELLPKLLDFGVAALVDDLQVTQSGTMSGSPPYMPPEQWRGLKHTDARSDVYALGVVAYQCLTNRLPFDADTAPAWMQKHCSESPDDLARFVSNDISKATQTVILKCLLKEPAQRFQSALALKRALEDAELGIAPEVPPSLAPTLPPSAVLKAQPEPKRDKTLLVALLSAAAAVALVFSLQYALQDPVLSVETPTKKTKETPALSQPAQLAIAPPAATQPQPGDSITNIPSTQGGPRAPSTPPPPVKRPPPKKAAPKPSPLPAPVLVSPAMTENEAIRATRALFEGMIAGCKDKQSAIVVQTRISAEGKVLFAMSGMDNPASKCAEAILKSAGSPNVIGTAYNVVLNTR